jgi:hypothetical protein
MIEADSVRRWNQSAEVQVLRAVQMPKLVRLSKVGHESCSNQIISALASNGSQQIHKLQGFLIAQPSPFGWLYATPPAGPEN